MGYYKRLAEEASERGWASTDKNICAACVGGDEALSKILAREADVDQECNFCHKPNAAPFDVFMEAFMAGIRHEYDNAANEVPWDSAEGGFHSTRTWDSWDLAESFDYIFQADGVLETVQSAMHDITWADRDFQVRERDVVLNEAWEKFCAAVRHRTRFVFWLTEDSEEALEDEDYGEISPARILHHVGTLLEDFDLIKDLPAGTVFYRARTHTYEGEFPLVAKQLGTAPASLAAQGNRMSPAGIPMFYGCENAEAALAEVGVRTANNLASVGLFETTTSCRVVDLTLLPPVPSMFDSVLGAHRRELTFLNRFADAISQPSREGFDQIDYVPTQVLVEYLLRVRWDSHSIAGIRYRSSALENESAVALDVANSDCLDQEQEADSERLQIVLKKVLSFRVVASWSEVSPSSSTSVNE